MRCLEDEPYEPLFEYGYGTMRERHDEYMARKTAEENRTVMNKQIGGTHYKDCAIQPIDYIVKNNLNFLEGNVVKYITRHKTKGEGRKDIEKVIHYAELLLELKYGKDK